MKWSFLLLFFTLFSVCVKGQDQKSIVQYFKSKNIDSLIMYCEYPFGFNVGSMEDDPTIKDKKTLKQKFDKLNKKSYFQSFIQKGSLVKEGDDIILVARFFNKRGELESESSLRFVFKRYSQGRFRLIEISMAG